MRKIQNIGIQKSGPQVPIKLVNSKWETWLLCIPVRFHLSVPVYVGAVDLHKAAGWGWTSQVDLPPEECCWEEKETGLSKSLLKLCFTFPQLQSETSKPRTQLINLHCGIHPVAHIFLWVMTSYMSDVLDEELLKGTFFAFSLNEWRVWCFCPETCL